MNFITISILIVLFRFAFTAAKERCKAQYIESESKIKFLCPIESVKSYELEYDGVEKCKYEVSDGQLVKENCENGILGDIKGNECEINVTAPNGRKK